MSDNSELVAGLRQKAEAATPGPWHWAGNTDTGEPYLATWIPGAGRCQVLAIGQEERSTVGRESDRVRRDAREYSLGEPDALVEKWAHDSFGEPMTDPRLQFMADLMAVNARDAVIYEVAPEATTRDDKRVYRADIVGIRHPDAEYIVAASPRNILALLDALESLTAEMHSRELHHFESEVALEEAERKIAAVEAIRPDERGDRNFEENNYASGWSDAVLDIRAALTTSPEPGEAEQEAEDGR